MDDVVAIRYRRCQGALRGQVHRSQAGIDVEP